HQGRTDCAGWGGNLSRAARVRGIAGTLVHGAVRDVDEARDLVYPVYAVAATPHTARGRAQEHAWNETITFAGVRVEPGDYVIADGTGIALSRLRTSTRCSTPPSGSQQPSRPSPTPSPMARRSVRRWAPTTSR